MKKIPDFFMYPAYKYKFGIEIPGCGWIGILSVSDITKQSIKVPQPPDPETGKPQPMVDQEVVLPVTVEGSIIDLKDGARPKDRLTAGDVFLKGFKDKHEVVLVHMLRPEEAHKEDGDVVLLRRYTLTNCKVLSYTLARHSGSEDALALEVVVLQPEDFSMETVQSDEIEALTNGDETEED